MMEKINLIYIDDQIDPTLSKHLYEYRKSGFNIIYDEVKFEGYEALVSDSRVTKANIIFIDSRLFQNSTASSGKYTGEQFKLILQRLFPYIEVIVITQNEIPEKYCSTISKYNSKMNQTSGEYYDELLNSHLAGAISRICEYRAIATEIKPDSDTAPIVDRINNSLDGIEVYDELKKTDIDNIIKLFKELQERLDEGL